MGRARRADHGDGSGNGGLSGAIAEHVRAEQQAQIKAEESERQRANVAARHTGGSGEPPVEPKVHRSRKAAAEKVGLSEASLSRAGAAVKAAKDDETFGQHAHEARSHAGAGTSCGAVSSAPHAPHTVSGRTPARSAHASAWSRVRPRRR